MQPQKEGRGAGIVAVSACQGEPASDALVTRLVADGCELEIMLSAGVTTCDSISILRAS